MSEKKDKSINKKSDKCFELLISEGKKCDKMLGLIDVCEL